MHLSGWNFIFPVQQLRTPVGFGGIKTGRGRCEEMCVLEELRKADEKDAPFWSIIIPWREKQKNPTSFFSSQFPLQPHLQKQRGLEVSLRWVAWHWATDRHLKNSSEEGKLFFFFRRKRRHRGRGKHQKVPEMSRGVEGKEAATTPHEIRLAKWLNAKGFRGVDFQG